MVLFTLKRAEGSVADVADDDLPACLSGDSDIKSERSSLAAAGPADQARRTRTMSKLPASSDSKDVGDRSVTETTEMSAGGLCGQRVSGTTLGSSCWSRWI